jgi:hypothetical protein
MRIIYCLSILLVLAGCAGGEQIAARQTAQQAAPSHKATLQAALRDADDAHCRQNRGAPGSIAYVACRIKMANNRDADEARAGANPSR